MLGEEGGGYRGVVGSRGALKRGEKVERGGRRWWWWWWKGRGV